MDDLDEVQEEAPLILSTIDLITPPGREYWLDDEMFKVDDREGTRGMIMPGFSVQETAKCFFGREADWLRWRMRPDKVDEEGKHRYPDGFFILDGSPMDFKRKPPKGKDPQETTARYFTLADIERMAHALTQQGVIDGVRLAHIVIMVRTCARLYGVTT